MSEECEQSLFSDVSNKLFRIGLPLVLAIILVNKYISVPGDLFEKSIPYRVVLSLLGGHKLS